MALAEFVYCQCLEIIGLFTLFIESLEATYPSPDKWQHECRKDLGEFRVVAVQFKTSVTLSKTTDARSKVIRVLCTLLNATVLWCVY